MQSNRLYLIYLLLCSDQTIYTGITTDVGRRLIEHKAGKGGSYTRSRKAVKILYTEKATNRPAALKREAAIKRLSHAQKLELIKNAQKPKTLKKNV